MKRSPAPQRKTPLKAGKPLERTTAWPAPATARSTLHANSAAQRHQSRRPSSPPAIPAKIRAGLKARSGGVCEIGQQGCTLHAAEASHRVRTGMGGRKGAALEAHHVLSNILHSCRACHSRAHSRPDEAYSAGWMLREHQNPLTERCLYRGAWRWLDDAGRVLDTNPNDAEEASDELQP